MKKIDKQNKELRKIKNKETVGVSVGRDMSPNEK